MAVDENKDKTPYDNLISKLDEYENKLKEFEHKYTEVIKLNEALLKTRRPVSQEVDKEDFVTKSKEKLNKYLSE